MRIAPVLFLTLLSASIALVGCTNTEGSYIITGVKRPEAKPENVKLYLTAPANFDVIGLVSSQGDGWSDQGKQDAAIEELKEQAAKIGANGLLLAGTGQKTGSAGGALMGTTFLAVNEDYKTASAQAIWVYNPN